MQRKIKTFETDKGCLDHSWNSCSSSSGGIAHFLIMIQRKKEEERMRILSREAPQRDWLIWDAVKKNLNAL